MKSDESTFSLVSLIDSSLFTRRPLEIFSQNAVHAVGICWHQLSERGRPTALTHFLSVLTCVHTHQCLAGPTGPLPRVCVWEPACPKVIIKKSAIELLSQISVPLSRDAESERGLMFGSRASLSLGLFALICHIFRNCSSSFWDIHRCKAKQVFLRDSWSSLSHLKESSVLVCYPSCRCDGVVLKTASAVASSECWATATARCLFFTFMQVSEATFWFALSHDWVDDSSILLSGPFVADSDIWGW